jgi:aspartate carbamoyltransferase catalytic subunit
MKLKHLIKSQQFDKELLSEIFDTSKQMESVFQNGQSKLLGGKILASLFYEPSTRTRLSFESAMMRLGGRIITTENAKEFSSAAKGENIEDTVRVISHYADAIVLRHHESGTCERASKFSDIPIINAGDGPGQHPTQALTDLYTIQKELNTTDDFEIAMVGDLQNGRTVRSLCYLLAKYNNIKITFVSPQVVRMKDDIKEYLTKHGVSFTEESNLLEVAKRADVIYQTRIQKERFSDNPEEYKMAVGKYIIDESVLSVMKGKSIIMHPLPRLDEISPLVDSDPRAAYFRQAKNAVYVRGAILKHLLT